MDDGFLRVWSLQEIETENGEESEFGLLFADYLINSWCYRLKPESDVASFVYVDCFDKNPAVVVARSLDDFFEVYAEDPKKVYAY
jgi:hypothetical protein